MSPCNACSKNQRCLTVTARLPCLCGGEGVLRVLVKDHCWHSGFPPSKQEKTANANTNDTSAAFVEWHFLQTKLQFHTEIQRYMGPPIRSNFRSSQTPVKHDRLAWIAGDSSKGSGGLSRRSRGKQEGLGNLMLISNAFLLGQGFPISKENTVKRN